MAMDDAERAAVETLLDFARNVCEFCSVRVPVTENGTHWIKGNVGGIVIDCKLPKDVREMLGINDVTTASQVEAWKRKDSAQAPGKGA